MFHDKYDMLKHEQTHATIVVIFVPNETPCNVCSMTFASIADIKQHKEDHHPESKIVYKSQKWSLHAKNVTKLSMMVSIYIIT